MTTAEQQNESHIYGEFFAAADGHACTSTEGLSTSAFWEIDDLGYDGLDIDGSQRTGHGDEGCAIRNGVEIPNQVIPCEYFLSLLLLGKMLIGGGFEGALFSTPMGSSKVK